MRAPWWVTALSVAVYVAVFVLVGFGISWWIAIAIFVPALLLTSGAAICARRFSAKPSSY